MELGYGNAKGGRSTSIAMDLWIKTCPNALKSQIDPKANLGYFLWKFSNSLKIKENIGWIGGENKGKSMATLPLIPYDVAVARSSRIWTNEKGGSGRTRRTQGTRRTQRGKRGRFVGKQRGK